MKIIFVVHDFSLTGAPRLGLQIAEVLAQTHDVTLVTKKDGPLRELVESGTFSDVIDVHTSHEVADLTLEERVNRAYELLQNVRPDLVYVNSIAAGDWVSAARKARCKVALHVHELQRSIVELQGMRLFDSYDISQADIVIAASDECVHDIHRTLRYSPERVINFGVCVDIEQIRQMGANVPSAGVRHDRRKLAWDKEQRAERRLVVMCGQSCERKGSDLFWKVAEACPGCDFLWVGPWDDDMSRRVNPGLSLNKLKPLDNFYWTNLVKNPFAFIARADLFVLTAREDPNPLVVPEAISLGVPVLTFRDSGGSHAWTSRYGYSLSGSVDPKRISDFISRFFSQQQFPASPDTAFFEAVDLKRKVRSMSAELERIKTPLAA